jgi:molybdopterin converting factor subunit 1
MNHLSILFFASLKEKAGISRITLELPDSVRVTDLKTVLFETYPALRASARTILVAVNHQYMADDDMIPDGAEVALFPPVSGGNGFPTYLRITSEELDLNELLAEITSITTGAACVFTGMVRGKTTRGQSHDTLNLIYEAYTSMAEEKMRQVADEIRSRWPDVEGISMVQRIGRMAPMTPTVVIACTASHRDTGVFEAARYGIDRLKEIVPIWKKEIGPNGETWIEGDFIPRSDEDH